MNIKKFFLTLFLEFKKDKNLLFIFFLGIFTIFFELHGSFAAWDEIIYNQVAREGIARGDWLTFYFYGEPWFEKPPLVIWLTMFSFKFLGDSEFCIWIFPCLAGVLSLVGIYYLGKIFCNKKVGLFSALILLMTPHFLLMSRNNMMDIFLLCFSIFSFLFILKSKDNSRNLILFWIFFALAFMSKSFASLVILPIIVYYIFLYRRIDIFKNKNFYIGFLIFLLIVLPWHIFMTLKFGNVFWQEYLGYHVLQRYSADILLVGDTNGIFYYLKLLPKIIGSWWIVLLFLVPTLLSNFKKNINKKEIKLFLFWISFLLVFFSISATRLNQYIIPLFVPFALMVALGLDMIYKYKNKNTLLILVIFIIIFNIDSNTISLYSDFNEVKILMPFLLHEIFSQEIVFVLSLFLIGGCFYGFYRKKEHFFDFALMLIFTFSFLLPFVPEKDILVKDIERDVKNTPGVEYLYLSDSYRDIKLTYSLGYYLYFIDGGYLNGKNFIYSDSSNSYCVIMKSDHEHYKDLSYDFFPCEVF